MLRDLTSQEDIEKACMRISDELEAATERECPELIDAWGDGSGAELDPQKVYVARMDEVKFIREMELYDKVTISECWDKTGKAPLSAKWIGMNKADQAEPK